ncbi:alpha/beta hydrolase [Novosphingobium sp. M1R2S20]|uniref:Alpha/beta hydrolase n=1 Tax=Novosphingobium rhizovicinum TaxID=3228928 RepID=A0ABV3RAR7_9SPHN
MRLPERRGYPAPPELAAIREQMVAAASKGAWRTGWPRIEESIAGVRCLRFVPDGKPRGRVLHAHGGGFRIGCPEAVEPYAVSLVRGCGVEVICPAYRLAPEHPFPAGLNDCLAVARAIGEEESSPLVLSGDSAGGGLAAAAVSIARREGLNVAGLVLHSPWLDLTLTAKSLHSNGASDPLFSLTAAQEASSLYLQGWPSDDPEASPLFAQVRAFPPTLMSVGSGEVLRDDARAFHQRLIAQEVQASLVEEEGMEHTAVVRGSELVGAPRVLCATQAFLMQVLPA